MSKGSNVQLMLVHYFCRHSVHASNAHTASRCSLSPIVAVPAHLIGVPMWSYPVCPTNEPHVYVAGECTGQTPTEGPSRWTFLVAPCRSICTSGTTQWCGYEHEPWPGNRWDEPSGSFSTTEPGYGCVLDRERHSRGMTVMTTGATVHMIPRSTELLN